MRMKVTFGEASRDFSANMGDNEKKFIAKHGEVQTINGKDGKSAYEIAVKNGFEGTETEWLESLKGEDYVLTEVDKQEIAEMVEVTGGGGVTSWNDLPDRPFGSTFGYVELASGVCANGSVTLGFTPVTSTVYKVVASCGEQSIEYIGIPTITNFPSMGYYAENIGAVGITQLSISRYDKTSDVWSVNINGALSEPYTVTVYEQTEAVTPINEKYLPKSVVLENEVDDVVNSALDNAVGNGKLAPVATTGLWEDITGRPFGIFVETQDIVSDANLSFTSGSTGPFDTTLTALIQNSPVKLIAENFYQITIDGTKYDCVCKMSGGLNLEPNPSGSHNVRLSAGTYYRLIATGLNGVHNVSISTMPTEVTKPLDEKYIPNTIARVEDVPTVADLIAALPIYNGEVESV